ncbi:hypothetical protein [Colwellia hornerae]|uniref:Outer membrane protein beta-barrel domain-containing protein n=1 Tax=Colwellia hornerae TaxID=89402 RepID=A0A5C6QTY5_9GAMM|nr:hypothetical protein [Colwellia hornerae]TWX57031.1 hypothetical protein ESZ28_04555 [Colwellia hornerae]TWX62244.1 hypothetical protein ESZ26_02335 [Colwellia hornerae]TWX72424.1 hypothetical protein ESZ27_01030 [Colwellia hornerae]
MNKFLTSICFSAASLLTFSVSAEESNQTIKLWSVGVGSYASTVNVDGKYGDEDIEFDGLNFSASYAFSDNTAIRASYFSLEYTDSSELESNGLDVAAYYGTGLASQGFKAYIGGGFFNDTWSSQNQDEKFSGIQLSGGFGYNWDVISLELMVGIRAADDYADFIANSGCEGEVVAVSSSLLLSLRF